MSDNTFMGVPIMGMMGMMGNCNQATMNFNAKMPERLHIAGEGIDAFRFGYTSGMARVRYLSIVSEDGVKYCTDSYNKPYIAAFDGGMPCSANQSAAKNGAIVTEDELKQFVVDMTQSGVLVWHGAAKSVHRPAGVTDTGELFELEILFTNGQIMSCRYSGCSPEDPEGGKKVIYDFFNAHTGK